MADNSHTKVLKGGSILAHLGPGQWFGEMALISDKPRMATVKRFTGVNVLTVDRDAFHALFEHLPPLRKLFEQLIEERMTPQ